MRDMYCTRAAKSVPLSLTNWATNWLDWKEVGRTDLSAARVALAVQSTYEGTKYLL
jgi:hypothetical protein